MSAMTLQETRGETVLTGGDSRYVENPFSYEGQHVSRWWQAFPLLVVALVLLAEAGTPDIRITPSILTVALAGFSLFLKPRMILIWAAVLVIPVVFSLAFVKTNGVREPPAVVALRTTAFLAVGFLAYALARTRATTRKQVADFSLLDALRTPVFVSDVDGAILYANQPLCDITGCEIDDLKRSSFFNHFAFSSSTTTDIDQYADWFLQKTGQTHRFQALKSKSGGGELGADLSVLDVGKTAYLLVQILPSGMLSDPLSAPLQDASSRNAKPISTV